MKLKNKMKTVDMVLALAVLGVIGLGSCKTKSEYPEYPQFREQQRTSIGDIAYIRPGEQLYFLDITVGSESKSIASFIPSSTENGEWPKITFEIEKDKLIVRGGIISTARPVDADGQNKNFYEKVQDLLTFEHIDMPTPNLLKGQYILDSEGLVREIIDAPLFIIYEENIWIIGNEQEEGYTIFLHTRDGKLLRSYIPENGYIVLPKKIAQTTIRIDIGAMTIFPKQRDPSGIQNSISTFFNRKLSHSQFSASNMIVKVYKAMKDGGFITIEENKKAKKFYLPPHQMIIYTAPKTTVPDIEIQDVEELPNQVLW